MQKETRTYNSIRNIVVACASQIISMVIGLVLRTFFIRYLGNEYLGMNSLFTSVLNIISMTEMGFTTVAVVSLYQPIADNDMSKLAVFVQYYRKVYLVIAGATLILGIAIMPFLNIFVNTENDIKNLYLYYLLFIINNSVSYLANYKLLVIKACQKEYLLSKQKIYVNITFTIVQILAMIVFHNYVLYLILMIGETFFISFMGSLKLKDVYPNLKLNVNGKLRKEEKQAIWKDIYSNFTYKMGTQLMTNSSDIFISTYAGTGTLGLYSNYAIFLNIVKSVMKDIYLQIYNSIGNLNQNENAKKREDIFEVCIFVYAFLLTIALCGIYSLGDDAITIWLGRDYLIEHGILAMACVNNYFYMMSYPVNTFRVTSKYMKESRYLSLIGAGIGIVAGTILGKHVGIVGVLGAIVLARVSTIFWYEPYILYKKVFEGSFFKYLLKQLRYILTIAVICVIESNIFKVYSEVSIIHFIVKIVLSVLISCAVFCIVNFKQKEFNYMLNLIKKIIRKR